MGGSSAAPHCGGCRDGLLTEAELKPVFHQLHPTEHDYARVQVGAKGHPAALCLGRQRAVETFAPAASVLPEL